MPARAQYLAYSGRPSQKLSIVPAKANNFQRVHQEFPRGGAAKIVAYNSVRWRKWALWIHWSARLPKHITQVQNPVDETITARSIENWPIFSSVIVVGGHLTGAFIEFRVTCETPIFWKCLKKKTWPVRRPWLDAFFPPHFFPIAFFPLFEMFSNLYLEKTQWKSAHFSLKSISRYKSIFAILPRKVTG